MVRTETLETLKYWVENKDVATILVDTFPTNLEKCRNNQTSIEQQDQKLEVEESTIYQEK